MRLLEALHRRRKAIQRKLKKLFVLFRTGSLVRRGLNEASDARSLICVSSGQFSDFALQFGEQLSQLASSFGAERAGVLQPGLNFRNRVANHNSPRSRARTNR